MARSQSARREVNPHFPEVESLDRHDNRGVKRKPDMPITFDGEENQARVTEHDPYVPMPRSKFVKLSIVPEHMYPVDDTLERQLFDDSDGEMDPDPTATEEDEPTVVAAPAPSINVAIIGEPPNPAHTLELIYATEGTCCVVAHDHTEARIPQSDRQIEQPTPIDYTSLVPPKLAPIINLPPSVVARPRPQEYRGTCIKKFMRKIREECNIRKGRKKLGRK